MTTLKEFNSPDQFDDGSTVGFFGFPNDCSINTVRNFASWFGPVIYVEPLPNNTLEKDFAVVFSSRIFAERLVGLKQVLFLDGKTNIKLFPPIETESMWNSVENIVTSATPSIQSAQEGLISLMNKFSLPFGI
ncbi:conserved Plasmodium protein, unknown function [Babesia microti strain RI]|uniref:RRM domain-containing protein n=1 Tax=Babesia microti (strain RI) TaxID=1133968 RepID=I7IQ70_BABMR|nr:conserved Plasmodium protein, unknown function [Babesia microti strain RI]CCF73545.1 conserved Plasmodium protein, unknown function [Babesia microti strain RI]|eukprot:XP_012648154.1 conserved Plasmodium protein, unknown function [Babesia microti strain RI]